MKEKIWQKQSEVELLAEVKKQKKKTSKNMEVLGFQMLQMPQEGE